MAILLQLSFSQLRDRCLIPILPHSGTDGKRVHVHTRRLLSKRIGGALCAVLNPKTGSGMKHLLI
jgi:hypothetical protein